jgi:hypothetical protein
VGFYSVRASSRLAVARSHLVAILADLPEVAAWVPTTGPLPGRVHQTGPCNQITLTASARVIGMGGAVEAGANIAIFFILVSEP